ncbi:MAG: transketolase [Alicyclobacillus macrosporangiidus]|uniref:transketolase n=1 Tax=Alicyclobacillus macrosporangiidus TaxID=392015 RepID=UPI0026F2BC3C|nr:transketolase [Alicyclobacillus macrosporangiidus]MCL6597604.1 transketolase [Alicyclobacillus macrosporangiidus]
MDKPVSISELNTLSHSIRKTIVEIVGRAQSGHPGAALSAVEILITLYFRVLRVDPRRPDWEDRDRFVLSKGHATPVLYATLAARGFFPADELATFRQIGSRLQGHPDMRKTPGVDMSTGSLAQGFASAVGMALGLRLRKSPAHVYALLGDGELNEGEVWEAAAIGAHYRLGNLTAIVDHNGKQVGGLTKEILDLGDLGAKWRAFGWNVLEVDGHDIQSLLDAFHGRDCGAIPTVVIAHTVKGKGVAFMEKGNEFYGEQLSAEDVWLAQAQLQSGV